ncbi:hypothetical protein KIW84_023016, partial [Lathyrus oleraceus]
SFHKKFIISLYHSSVTFLLHFPSSFFLLLPFTLHFECQNGRIKIGFGFDSLHTIILNFLTSLRDPSFPLQQAMVKGHGLYTDIGKKARDILYKDYHSDKKFTISTYSLTGVHIVRSGKDKRDSYLLEREVENLQVV